MFHQRRTQDSPSVEAIHRANIERARVKAQQVVFDHYGRVCACPNCPFHVPPVDWRFLSVDHINNDAAKLAGGYKRRKKGTSLYRYLAKLIRLGTPATDIQILCFACNQAKQRNRGVCPHTECLDNSTGQLTGQRRRKATIH